MAAVAVELPKCKLCDEVFTAPVYNCQTGHSLCANCNSNIVPAICPFCRQPMTQMRNMEVERIISEAMLPCPNKAQGCVYTLMRQDIDDHVKECIFKKMSCPLGVIFGKCSWNGLVKDMMDHCKDRHPENCNVSTDTEVELDNISITVDDRHVFLVAQGKLLFIITMKIDTTNKMAYWIVQLIGSQRTAQQHVYEIHIYSKQDIRRKAMFFEYCFNDDMKPDEIFELGKCCIMPSNMLKHFIDRNKLAFRFLIKRITENPNKNNHNKRDPSKGPSGAGPRGPGGPGPRGPRPGRSPGFHGPRPNNRGFGHGGHRNPSPFPAGGFKEFKHPFNFDN